MLPISSNPIANFKPTYTFAYVYNNARATVAHRHGLIQLILYCCKSSSDTISFDFFRNLLYFVWMLPSLTHVRRLAEIQEHSLGA
ncbi:MAG: hypothetical protein ABFS45_12070 [Pseudomonadota bacterium]